MSILFLYRFLTAANKWVLYWYLTYWLRTVADFLRSSHENKVTLPWFDKCPTNVGNNHWKCKASRLFFRGCCRCKGRQNKVRIQQRYVWNVNFVLCSLGDFLQTSCFSSRAGGSMQTAAPGQTGRIAVRQPRSRADGPARADLRDASCSPPPGAAAGCRSWLTEFPCKRIRFNCALWTAEGYNLYWIDPGGISGQQPPSGGGPQLASRRSASCVPSADCCPTVQLLAHRGPDRISIEFSDSFLILVQDNFRR